MTFVEDIRLLESWNIGIRIGMLKSWNFGVMGSLHERLSAAEKCEYGGMPPGGMQTGRNEIGGVKTEVQDVMKYRGNCLDTAMLYVMTCVIGACDGMSCQEVVLNISRSFEK